MKDRRWFRIHDANFNSGELISEEQVSQSIGPGENYEHYFDINDFSEFGERKFILK